MTDGIFVPLKARSAAAIFMAAACAAASNSAMAVDLSAGVTVGVERDSNAFELATIEGAPLVDGVPGDRDDASRHLTANATASFGGEGPTQLRLNAIFTRFESGNSDSLSRNDYTFGGVLDWRPSQAFDVSLEASQDRLPLGLADVGGADATQRRTRQTTATLRLRPTPRWQISLVPGWNESQTSLQDAPDFKLRETSGWASLDYLGAGRLVPGLGVSTTRGKYYGVVDATRYHQWTVQGTLEYEASGFSSFNLVAGHTTRSTRLLVPSGNPDALAIEGNDSAFTGALNYHRQLSVKTGFDISAFRYFEQYDAGVNTTVGNGLNFGVRWDATAKLSVNLGSALILSTIEGVPEAGADGERVDLIRRYSMAVTYQVTRMVALRTHVTRHIRRSEVWTDQFNSTIAGLELTAAID